MSTPMDTPDGKFWCPTSACGIDEHQKVQKVTGEYRFPGVVLGIVRTPEKYAKYRLVVMSTSKDTYGMMHVFAPEQMEPVEREINNG